MLVDGPLDLATAPQLWSAAMRELNEAPPVLSISVANIDSCDAFGAGILVSLVAKARERGTEVVLEGPCEPVQRWLALMGRAGVPLVEGSTNAEPELLRQTLDPT